MHTFFIIVLPASPGSSIYKLCYFYLKKSDANNYWSFQIITFKLYVIYSLGGLQLEEVVFFKLMSLELFNMGINIYLLQRVLQ